DENTVFYYLQKFSDDLLMKKLLKRLSEDELSEIFNLITRLLKVHLTDTEYHDLFLKEES
ncbi:MAG: cytoplasmic protein, partial [Desulfobacterales bacterium]